MSDTITVDEDDPFVIINKILVHSKGVFSVYEKMAIISLLSYSNNGRTDAFPSHQTLAGDIGCKKTKSFELIKELERKGVLTKEPRYSVKGDRTSNSYTLRKKVIRKLCEKAISPCSPHEQPPLEGCSPHEQPPLEGCSPHEQPPVRKTDNNKKYNEREIPSLPEEKITRFLGSTNLESVTPIRRKDQTTLPTYLPSDSLRKQTRTERAKQAIKETTEQLTREGYAKEQWFETFDTLLTTHAQVDLFSGFNSIHYLDPQWIAEREAKGEKVIYKLLEAIDSFKTTHKPLLSKCRECGQMSAKTSNKSLCKSCYDKSRVSFLEKERQEQEERDYIDIHLVHRLSIHGDLRGSFEAWARDNNEKGLDYPTVQQKYARELLRAGKVKMMVNV